MSDHTDHQHSALTESEHEKWHQFVDGVSNLIETVFGEQEPGVIIGAQFGDEETDDEPRYALAANIVICSVPDALVELVEVAEADHDRAHREYEQRREADLATQEEIKANVPPEIREAAERFAESIGMDASAIQYVEIAPLPDTSDLDDLPETAEPVRHEFKPEVIDGNG